MFSLCSILHTAFSLTLLFDAYSPPLRFPLFRFLALSLSLSFLSAKGKKGRRTLQETAEEARERAELELLVLDSKPANKGDFKINAQDPRFQAFFKNSDFAVDPTNKEYKPSEGMQKLLAERQKKRAHERVQEEEQVRTKKRRLAEIHGQSDSLPNESVADGGEKTRNEIAQLVESLKRVDSKQTEKTEAKKQKGKGVVSGEKTGKKQVEKVKSVEREGAKAKQAGGKQKQKQQVKGKVHNKKKN